MQKDASTMRSDMVLLKNKKFDFCCQVEANDSLQSAKDFLIDGT